MNLIGSPSSLQPPTGGSALKELRADHEAPGTTVVAGAARGIGAAVAKRIAAESWTQRIVLADIDGSNAEQLAAELRDKGHDAESHTFDITVAEQVRELLERAPDARRLAIVSGVFEDAGALEVDEASFRRIVEINLLGPFFLAQAFAGAMVERGGGAIVGVASIAARMPRMRQAAYCASKAGMRQALRTLGMEVATSGVRVNTVSPGATDTEMTRSLAGDDRYELALGSLDTMRPRIPHGRIASPEDIADGVAYLLSPAAIHVLLQDLVIDGGELLGM